jgi:hypothetical protein
MTVDFFSGAGSRYGRTHSNRDRTGMARVQTKDVVNRGFIYLKMVQIDFAGHGGGQVAASQRLLIDNISEHCNANLTKA